MVGRRIRRRLLCDLFGVGGAACRWRLNMMVAGCLSHPTVIIRRELRSPDRRQHGFLHGCATLTGQAHRQRFERTAFPRPVVANQRRDPLRELKRLPLKPPPVRHVESRQVADDLIEYLFVDPSLQLTTLHNVQRRSAENDVPIHCRAVVPTAHERLGQSFYAGKSVPAVRQKAQPPVSQEESIHQSRDQRQNSVQGVLQAGAIQVPVILRAARTEGRVVE